MQKILEDEFPELLFESFLIDKHSCFVCGNRKAVAALYSTKDWKPFIPICKQCRFNWNLYGYYILRKIDYKIILKLIILNPLSLYSTYQRIMRIRRWSEKMKEFKKCLKY